MKISIIEADLSLKLELAYAEEGIQAGFPSPAQDYSTQPIDLNRELITHPASTFYARAIGDSMKGRGIDSGDLLVIDKSLEPHDGDVVVAYIDGEFTLKSVKLEPNGCCLWLVPENDKYPPIKVTKENNFMVWGVLTYNIKRQLGRR